MHPNDLQFDQTLDQQPEEASSLGYAPLVPADADPVTPAAGQQIDAACNRIAPVWPLDRFVAVNPFHGWWSSASSRRRQRCGASPTRACTCPAAGTTSSSEAGRITDADLREAARRCDSKLTPRQLREAAAGGHPEPTGGVPLLTALVDEMDADDWSSFVVERISHHCAAYFDMGQATWKRPWEGMLAVRLLAPLRPARLQPDHDGPGRHACPRQGAA
jgi:hypothetical protein